MHGLLLDDDVGACTAIFELSGSVVNCVWRI